MSDSRAKSPFQTQKYSDIASQLIRDRILSGEFEPGERINEIVLSEQLEISRSPLREALRDLSSEGLVTMVPGRGAFVAKLDAESIVQLGEVRLALETFAVRLAAERADEPARERLREVMKGLESALSKPGTAYPHKIDFHAAVGQATGNQRMAQITDEVERQLRLVRIASGNSPERAQQAHHEHKVIFDAVMDRDPDAAEAAMRVHLNASIASIIELMAGAPEPPTD